MMQINETIFVLTADINYESPKADTITFRKKQ